MKKLILSVIAVTTLSLSSYTQDLPGKSPIGKVEQKIGLTNVSLTYSRPSVRDREIFGELVPFNEVWRFGANKATTLTIDRDVQIAGQDLPLGSYAIFVTPKAAGTWTLVFNTDTEQWGSGSYDAAKNKVTIEVPVNESDKVETMSLWFSDLEYSSGMMNFAWNETKFSVRIDVDTDDAAEENIKMAIEKGEELEKVYYNAADFYQTSKGDLKTAMENIEKSISIKEYHANVFQKALILKDMKKDKDALKVMTKAQELAKKAEKEGWANYIQKKIDAWSTE